MEVLVSSFEKASWLMESNLGNGSVISENSADKSVNYFLERTGWFNNNINSIFIIPLFSIYRTSYYLYTTQTHTLPKRIPIVKKIWKKNQFQYFLIRANWLRIPPHYNHIVNRRVYLYVIVKFSKVSRRFLCCM